MWKIFPFLSVGGLNSVLSNATGEGSWANIIFHKGNEMWLTRLQSCHQEAKGKTVEKFISCLCSYLLLTGLDYGLVIDFGDII